MTLRTMTRTMWAATALLGLAAWAGVPADAAAQEESFPGVRLGLVYESAYTPGLAIKPMIGRFGGAAAATQVEAILGRDLRYSDRFQVLDSIPPALAGGEGIDYTLWDRLGAVWLLDGTVEGSGEGYVVVLRLHDVVYGRVEQAERFRIPDPTDPDFRMAVHRISDKVVEWTFGEPGMAASRVAFSLRRNDGSKELYLIDSDGENLRRVTDYGGITISPTWSPDARRVAYMTDRNRPWEIWEKNLESGEERLVEIDRDDQVNAPSYHPDGERIAFSVQGGRRSGLYIYNVRQECCLTNLTESTASDFSPSFSPDGERLAFTSNRLGERVPQIFVMDTDGGEADLLSPYRFGEQGYYTSPDWSPLGDLVAFHGRVGRSGRYHILVARLNEEGRLLQLTSDGNNEDPSWAPDGRHLVFKGERSWGKGLFVVDTATGAIRVLLRGVDVTVPQWSPSMGGR